MRDAARTLAGYGRNGDDMLLHVSRKELEGIRSLTGRNFTRNPDTGLPEAFNFASLIPIAAGVVGTVVGGPLAGAAAAGAASAGTAAAQGATTEEALTQGLISGVTSYAGGQLLTGVGEAAAGAAGQGAGQAAAQGAGTAATGAAAGVPGDLMTSGVTEAIAASPTVGTGVTPGVTPGLASGAAAPGVDAAIANQTAQGLSASGLQAGYDPGIQAFGTPAAGAGATSPTGATPGLMQGIGDRASAFGQRVSNIANDPGAAISRLGQNIYDRPDRALLAGAGLASSFTDMMGGSGAPEEEPYDPNRYPERFPTNPRSWNAPPSSYIPGYSPEYRYFAEGGLATLRNNSGYTENLMNEAKAALLGEHPRPQEAIERFREAFGSDALAVLRDRVNAGRVRGAGGGMDDLVPGSIEGRQRVRLADGEFVIPSDVVSGLGDGSTDQGVRRLHGLMNKVRQQRTGKKAQPKAIGGKITL